MLPLLVIGNPQNRRVQAFLSALASRGRPPARVFAWESLLTAAGLRQLSDLPDVPMLVRLDSFGENFAVDRLLYARGYAAATAEGVSTIEPERALGLVEDRGLFLCPRQHHLGFLSVLDDLEAVFAAHPRWRILNPPSAIRQLFDKRLTSRLYHRLGVPVPPVIDGVDNYDALRARLDERDCHAAYVKLASGSSASGLGLYQRRGDSESLLTSLELTRTGWYNNLKVRRYTDAARITAIVNALCREGAQVEESVDKARLDGRVFDCRVLVVAGEPAFIVVRTSSLPITNLHLGGTRGDLTALRAACPPEAWEAAMASCRTVHAAHGALHVGIDLLFEPRYVGHRVIEANAFGDLLPGLTHQGLSVYEWEIEASEAWSE